MWAYIGSTADKTEKQQNLNANNDVTKVIDVNAYIKALKVNHGNKAQAASAAWRTLNLKNILGFIIGTNFIDLRDENEINERFGEEIYNSLTKSMVNAMEQQQNQDNAELENEHPEAPENPEQPIDENFKAANHEFNMIHLGNETIYVGKEGILGDREVFIPWKIIAQLLQKYYDVPSYRKL